MKTLLRIGLCAVALFSLVKVSSGGELHYISAGVTNVSSGWNVNVPAGTVVHSYVVAEAGGVQTWQFSFYSGTFIKVYLDPNNTHSPYVWAYNEWDIQQVASFDPDYLSGSATIQAGIAGPPAGQVHLARADASGYYQTVADEKWSTLAGGSYQIWHGGGSSGNGLVAAATDLTW